MFAGRVFETADLMHTVVNFFLLFQLGFNSSLIEAANLMHIGVNFINILRAAFASIFFWKFFLKPNC